MEIQREIYDRILEWKTRAKVLLFCVSRKLYFRFNLLLKTKSIRTEPGREML